MPPNTPHPRELAKRDKQKREIQRAAESKQIINSYLGLDSVAAGIKATGFTQTEQLDILAEIARDHEANNADKIRAITVFQRTVERAAELNGQIGKASVEERSEDGNGRLVRRVEVSKLIAPDNVSEEDFVSFSSEVEHSPDRESLEGSGDLDDEG